MRASNPLPSMWTLLVLSIACNNIICYKVKLLQKNAVQVPNNWRFPASRAVDGKKATGHDDCTHTLHKKNAWWEIELTGLYVVDSVWLLNRNGAEQRLSEFNISVGNQSVQKEQKLCRYYPDMVPKGGSKNISCDTRVVGSYVSVRKTTSAGDDYLSLCEVEVYGYRICQAGRFNNDCVPCNCNDACSLETGKCPSACLPGWLTDNCQQACENKKWGLNCANFCMCKDSKEACNKTNGLCKSGCKDNYVGAGCEKELPTVAILTTRALSSSSISVVWKPTGNPKNSLLLASSLVIQYRLKQDSAWTNRSVDKSDTGTGSILKYTVSGLTPNRIYLFRIIPQAMYEGVQYDVKPTNVSSETKTQCEAPVAPLILQSIARCNSQGETEQIYVSWEKLDDKGHRCESWLSVSVVYRVKGEDALQHINLSDTSTTSVLNNITKPGNVYYDVRIQVYNDENAVNSSAWVMAEDPLKICAGPSSINNGIVAGIATVAILFIVLIIVGTFFLIRQRRKHRESTEKEMSIHMTHQPNGGSVVNNDVEVDGDTDGLESAHDNRSFQEETEPKVKKDHPAIPVDDLEMYIEKARATAGSFLAEFKGLDDGFTAPCTVADKLQNKKKNRFANIKAYDHSRVVLQKLEGDPHSDYINACYIDGYKSMKAYVASQGANKANVNDIWRLVWCVKANRVIMVTNLIEGGKRKCELYWPESGSQTYGEITATLLSTQQYADFVIRSFTLNRNGESQNVRHFHYTAWPDKDVPQYATSLLAFHRKVRAFDKTAKGPMVVHCSAGVGRTGTFLALDYLLEQAKTEKQVNVYKCVEQLRKDRPNMVQTLVQYIFVYDSLLEALRAGNTAILCSQFPEEFTDLCNTDSHGKTELQKQFQMLKSYVPKLTEEDIKTALKADNKAKNRDTNVLPVGACRAYLSGRVPGRNDYINAVYVHGHKMRNAYIATQAPLPDTVIDFWRLINEHHSSSIVMVNKLNEAKRCPRYWPEKDEKPMELGPLKIQCTEVDKSNSNFHIRKFKIRNAKSTDKEDQIVKHYELTTWPDGAPVPDDADSVLELLENLERWQQQSSNRPITVHCLDGATRSGMLCVVSSVLEKMKIDQEVDVIHFVKKVRIHRPQAIPNAEQFKFCHEAALVYMDKFEQYANFK